ncbi:hypothetical protein AB4Y45_23155 [Paraburkholderia sp. EG287A]|uniref:hypothetical protein n=1 Tax=Paraburkholderia sp. EG287A TaxID=3237012 RepID=UPI0034D17CB5
MNVDLALGFEPFRHSALIHFKDAPSERHLRYLGWDPDSDLIAFLEVNAAEPLPYSRVPILKSRRKLFTHRGDWDVVDECVCPQWMIDWNEDVVNKSQQRQMAERDARLQKLGAMLTIGKGRLLFDSQYRSELIKEAAEESNVSEQVIRKLLTRYWWFGATKDALLTRRPDQGGPGEERIDVNTRKPGPQLSTVIENPRTKYQGVRMTRKRHDEWETFLVERAEEIYDQRGQVGLAGQFQISSLWLEFRDTVLVRRSMVDGQLKITPIPLHELPRRRQYLYFGKKIFQKRVLKKYFDSEYDWDAAKARVGHSTDHTRGRIVIYEFDGLLFNAQLLWGKHIINRVGKACVVIGACVETSAIVGVHITIQNESTNAYRNCLLNSFVPKDELLSTFGLESLAGGFVHGSCDEARFDRGPGIAENLRGPLTDEMKIGVRITRSRKGRDKPLVESFNRGIQDALAKLPGFYKRTRAGHDKDGQAKAERWAKIQFEDFVRLVLTYIHDWNTGRNIYERLPVEFAKSIDSPTPKGYFDAFRLERLADAAVEWTPKEIYSKLLPTIRLRVSKKGSVKYRGARYTSQRLQRRSEEASSTPSGKRDEMFIHVKAHPDTNRFLIWMLDDGTPRTLNMMMKYRRHFGTTMWLVQSRSNLRGRASKHETEMKSRERQLPSRMTSVIAKAEGLKPRKGTKRDKVANRKAKAEDEKRQAEVVAHAMFGVTPVPVPQPPPPTGAPGFYNPDADKRFDADI